MDMNLVILMMLLSFLNLIALFIIFILLRKRFQLLFSILSGVANLLIHINKKIKD
jgi:hypothetical protein